MNPKLLQKAIDLAYLIYEPDFEARSQHFSMAVYKGKVISIAKNSIKTNPTNLLNPKFSSSDSSLDISGVRGSCSELRLAKKLKNLTNIPFNRLSIINIRINKNKQLDLAKPCFSCSRLLNEFFGVRELFYTDKTGGFQKYV